MSPVCNLQMVFKNIHGFHRILPFVRNQVVHKKQMRVLYSMFRASTCVVVITHAEGRCVCKAVSPSGEDAVPLMCFNYLHMLLWQHPRDNEVFHLFGRNTHFLM